MAIYLNKAKNYIQNGALDHWQRATSFAAIATATYTADRFVYTKSGTMVHTLSRDTDVPTIAQAGVVLPYSMRLALTTAQATLTTTQHCMIEHRMEGVVFAPLAGKTVTYSFWIKAVTPGTYPIAFRNSAVNKSLVKTFVIASANTWEKQYVTMTHETAGTWDYTSGIGLRISFVAASGPTLHAPVLGSWLDGDYLSHSSCVNGVATGSTDLRIAGLQLEEGSSVSGFERYRGDALSELMACMRYYEQTTAGSSGTAASTFSRYSAVFRTRKRVAPSVSFTILGGQNAVAPSSSIATLDGVYGHSNGGSVNDWTAWTVSADAEL